VGVSVVVVVLVVPRMPFFCAFFMLFYPPFCSIGNSGCAALRAEGSLLRARNYVLRTTTYYFLAFSFYLVACILSFISSPDRAITVLCGEGTSRQFRIEGYSI